MLRSLMLVAVLVIGPVLPAAAQQVSEEDARQIVVSITGAYIKAIQKGDAAGLAALYTADGLIVRPAGPVSGMEGIKRFYEEVVKVVVDIEKKIMAIGGEMHADEEKFLLEYGSKQEDLWGINIFTDLDGPDMIEFDSIINVRPRTGNRSRGVEDAAIRERIVEVVGSLLQPN